MEEIILVLYQYKNRTYKESTYTHIAKILLKNINQIQYYSLEKIAQSCHVSIASINRFMKEIGYGNYSNFRHIFRITPTNSFKIKHFNDAINSQEFYLYSAFASLLHASNKIVLNGYGLIQLYHQKLQYNLTYLGKLSDVYYQTIEQKEQIHLLTSNDLLIITSLEGKYFEYPSLLEDIKICKAKKILITKSFTKFNHYFDLIIPITLSLLDCYEKITYYYSSLINYE